MHVRERGGKEEREGGREGERDGGREGGRVQKTIGLLQNGQDEKTIIDGLNGTWITDITPKIHTL